MEQEGDAIGAILRRASDNDTPGGGYAKYTSERRHSFASLSLRALCRMVGHSTRCRGDGHTGCGLSHPSSIDAKLRKSPTCTNKEHLVHSSFSSEDDALSVSVGKEVASTSDHLSHA